MARMNIDAQLEAEPKRIEYAKQELSKLGYEITYEDNTKIQFDYKGNTVTMFPYSGWYSGKKIKSGRGIHELLKLLK